MHGKLQARFPAELAPVADPRHPVWPAAWIFIIRFFWKTFGCALLQILYWAAIVLFLPWSVILLPFLGIWFILFTSNFLLYDTIDGAFHIEEEIAQAFPEQAAFYEDDETWLKRKQAEQGRRN